MQFSQSEVVLHSDIAKYRKICGARLIMFLRMVGEYRPCTCCLLLMRIVFEKVQNFVENGENAIYKLFKMLLFVQRMVVRNSL